MTASPDTVPTEALLAQTAWLRGLARQLVGDEARAEDAVQDVLVAALERERGGRVPGRAWLAAVLRNVARLGGRAAARRSAREAAHARDRAEAREAPSAVDALARLEAQRRLLEAVAALEEPYRSTIALRFLDGLPPREIARRQGVPVETVRTRIGRGLARLRERLDRAYGERGAWCAAVAALGRLGPPSAAALGAAAGIGGIAMGAAVKWVAAAAAVVLVGVVIQRAQGGDREPARPDASAKAEPEAPVELVGAGAPLEPVNASGESGARAALAAPETERAARPAPSAPAAAEATFAGRVVDLAGRPVAGAEVVLLKDPEAAPSDADFAAAQAPDPASAAQAPDLASEAHASDPASDAASAEPRRAALADRDGVFTLPVAAGRGRLHARAPGLAAVVAPVLVWMPPPTEPVVVLGPERRYAGRVVDADGGGIAGMHLWIRLPAEAPSASLDALAWDADPSVFATTGEDGAFRLPPVGYARGMKLVAISSARITPELALPDADALDLVLVAGATSEELLAGRVVDAAGRGIAGAYVIQGPFAVACDERGAFTLAREPGAGSELRAAAPGLLPARISLEGLSPEERATLTIVLDGRPRTIAGRVLDHEGRPVPGAHVWSLDVERFGGIAEQSGETWIVLETSTERLLQGDVGHGVSALADADGRFELGGLLDRAYVLNATDLRTLATARDVPIQAGAAGVELWIRGEPVQRVAGRVTSLSGLPLEGVRVFAYRGHRTPDGERGPQVPHSGGEPHAVSDEEGAFSFDALATRDVSLILHADDGANATIPLEREADLEHLEARLAATCWLRVVQRTGDGDGFRVIDANGASASSAMSVGAMTFFRERYPLTASGDAVIKTDERAAALVLFQGDREVRRVPLALKPGETVDVEL